MYTVCAPEVDRIRFSKRRMNRNFFVDGIHFNVWGTQTGFAQDNWKLFYKAILKLKAKEEIQWKWR